MKSMMKRVAALMLVGVVFAACSESGIDSPVGPEFAQQAVELPQVVSITVCKVYRNDAAQGTYTFSQSGAQTAPGEFDLTAGNGIGQFPLLGCNDAGATTVFQVNRGSTFTVTELAVGLDLATLESVSIVPYEGEPGDNPAACTLNEAEATILASGSASVTIDNETCFGDTYQITFKNTRLDTPPEGGEGCTPGYWRQEHHYGNWTGYSPSDLFVDVFGRDDFPGETLGEVVMARGGGINALGRHAVAALLNTANLEVSYGMTTDGVIAAYQAASDAGGDAIENQKNLFDAMNNAGCELGRAELESDIDASTLGKGKNKKNR
jgi:hypothetical protein